jgi:hypothetical protein
MGDREEVARRLRLALDLADAAEAMMRQNLARRLPAGTSDPAAIEAGLRTWRAGSSEHPSSHFAVRRSRPT